MSDQPNSTDTSASEPADLERRTVGAPARREYESAHLPQVDRQTREDVFRTDDPEPDDRLEDSLARRAIQEVRSRGTLPLPGTVTEAMTWAAIQARALLAAESREEESFSRRDAGREETLLGTLPRGLTTAGFTWAVLLALTAGVGVVLAQSRLAQESWFYFITRGVYAALGVGDRAAFELAWTSVLFMSGAVMGGPLLVVLATSGRLPRVVKAAFWLAEPLFAAGLVGVRVSGAGPTPQVIALAAIELAISLVGAGVCTGLATFLERGRKLADAHALQGAMVAQARLRLAEATRRRLEAERLHALQVAAVQRREEDEADRERDVPLAEATSRAAYQVTVREVRANLEDGVARARVASRPHPRPLLSVVRDE